MPVRDMPLVGKTILLHAEQGFGDTLQFVRYAPRVVARGARVILEVQKPLRELMTKAAAESGEQYSVIYRSDAPAFQSEGALRTGPKRPRKPPEWHERHAFARELAREERQESRDRHRASSLLTGGARAQDPRPGRQGDERQ